jgi:hypothetical protein
MATSLGVPARQAGPRLTRSRWGAALSTEIALRYFLRNVAEMQHNKFC